VCLFVLDDSLIKREVEDGGGKDKLLEKKEGRGGERETRTTNRTSSSRVLHTTYN
jgi:hypothetical protein